METIVKIKCNKCGEEHSRYHHCDLDQQRKEDLNQLDIESYNDFNRMETKTGRSTRLADYYIQEIFSKPNEAVEIIDHENTKESNMQLTRRIIRRILEEHVGYLEIVNLNTLKYSIKH